jgi:hypothetical protein
MKLVNLDVTTHQWCCGVREFGNFMVPGLGAGWASGIAIVKGGTGLYTATFINDEHCKAGYEYLTKKYKLLYQSPLRRNGKKGNLVFLCVFSDKKRK